MRYSLRINEMSHTKGHLQGWAGKRCSVVSKRPCKQAHLTVQVSVQQVIDGATCATQQLQPHKSQALQEGHGTSKVTQGLPSRALAALDTHKSHTHKSLESMTKHFNSHAEFSIAVILLVTSMHVQAIIHFKTRAKACQ